MEPDTKPWYASKGVIGGVIAVLAAVAGIFGVSFGADAQEEAVQQITLLISGFGGIIAIWGRLTATKLIGKQS